MAGTRHAANDAWEALLSAHATLMKEFAAQDTWDGISMREYDVLYTLSKCPGPARMSELNRHVLLSQPALSRLVDRLAARGLVERRPDDADGRGVRLALTAAGRRLQREVGRQHARGVARAVRARLDPDEYRELEALCRKLAGEPAPPAGESAPASAGIPDQDQDRHQRRERRRDKDLIA
jgi:DNA-binding MarR family transcriptional regulator